MPTPERVRAFIARVEALDHLGAIRDFYHADATMQENLGQKREGMEALLAGEKAALKRMGGAPASKCRSLRDQRRHRLHQLDVRDGRPDGKTRTLNEIAVQHWRGDRIATEQFYYDPAQIR